MLITRLELELLLEYFPLTFFGQILFLLKLFRQVSKMLLPYNFCQAQPQLQLSWAELALTSISTPTHSNRQDLSLLGISQVLLTQC